MRKRRLGKSGLEVSPLAFGGNVFGDVQIAPLREADPKIPKTVKDRVQTIERGLKSGSVKTGVQTR